MKAIHNSLYAYWNVSFIVPDLSKIHFWKQFTTVVVFFFVCNKLFPICQRYIFESNSQRRYSWAIAQEHCSRFVKDTFLKAIHNLRIHRQNLYRLFPICQRYIFESNSQRNFYLFVKHYYCSRFVKDTFLKAIHNKL